MQKFTGNAKSYFVSIKMAMRRGSSKKQEGSRMSMRFMKNIYEKGIGTPQGWGIRFGQPATWKGWIHEDLRRAAECRQPRSRCLARHLGKRNDSITKEKKTRRFATGTARNRVVA